jgi:hypothetical protein
MAAVAMQQRSPVEVDDVNLDLDSEELEQMKRMIGSY